MTFYNGSTLGMGTVGTGGMVTITTTALPIGTDSITASYGGDSNNNPATGTALQTVAKAAATVTLTSSSNPSAAGAAVTFSATVYAGATAPVTFFDGIDCAGYRYVATQPALRHLRHRRSRLGSHSITAAYPGDANYSAANICRASAGCRQDTDDDSVTASTPAELFNSQVTFTAVVTAALPTPTGTVTFMDGSTTLGSAPLSTNGGVVVTLTSGNAAFATSSLTTGDHKITAVYSGDNSFATSTSAPLDNVVEDFTVVNSGAASQQVAPGASTTYNFKVTPRWLVYVCGRGESCRNGSACRLDVYPDSDIGCRRKRRDGDRSERDDQQFADGRKCADEHPDSRASCRLRFGMLGLAGLGTVRKLRRKLPRPFLLLLLTIATLLPIAALSGCAGGYFALDPHTYTVTLTGTEGSIQHTATATLVVQ